jgi:hypothetical protein
MARWFGSFLCLAILGTLVSCSSSSQTPETSESAPPATPTAMATPASTPAPTATAVATAPAPTLPPTPVSAVLGQAAGSTYKVEIGTFKQLTFETSELPAVPGSVQAYWFKSGGRYVVAFVGFDPAAAGPLCPGSSIQTDKGFQFVSNAPTEAGSCNGYTTLTSDPLVGPRVCHNTLLYVTLIPSDTQGLLYGTVEALADNGTAIVGLTSTVQSSADIPEIDLDGFCGTA